MKYRTTVRRDAQSRPGSARRSDVGPEPP
jgi:hypothetical protein